MRIEGFLLIVTPIAFYGLLVMLPSERGLRISSVLSLVSAIGLIAAMLMAPDSRSVDLVPFIATLLATMLFSGSAAAFGYHRTALRRGGSLSLRAAFLAAGGFMGWAIFTLYRAFS